MNPTRQQARFSGLPHLLLALIAPIGLLYVPGELIVSGNATATRDSASWCSWRYPLRGSVST